ncbi:dTMP kinase [candidate division NPL-UPA2 bacterium]|nr:dTMP kinase [candidate division NPL-UPA2 bacterium]
MKGIFITLEGPEGSGKSTQARKLSNYLEKKGLRTIVSREPGGTEIGQKVRKILLSPTSKGMEALTELFLYLAVRAQHVKEVIKPALSEGKIVISDRFLDATLAYQSYGRGLDRGLVNELNRLVIQGLKPDLTILLDIEIPQGMKRARGKSGKGDRIEQEKTEFHQRVREGYLKLVKEEPERIKRIKVEGSIEETQTKLRQCVDELLLKKG